MLGPGGPVPHLETGLKEPQQKNLLKSNECLIPKLGNHVGYVNSPTRKGGSQIQNRTLTLNYIVQYAQRTMAEGTHFLCAGRAEFSEIL